MVSYTYDCISLHILLHENWKRKDNIPVDLSLIRACWSCPTGHHRQPRERTSAGEGARPSTRNVTRQDPQHLLHQDRPKPSSALLPIDQRRPLWQHPWTGQFRCHPPHGSSNKERIQTRPPRWCYPFRTAMLTTSLPPHASSPLSRREPSDRRHHRALIGRRGWRWSLLKISSSTASDRALHILPTPSVHK
jgi:hypothetical protein